MPSKVWESAKGPGGANLGRRDQAWGDISLLTRGHPGTKVWGASGAPELQAQVEAIECDELS